jgi:phosphoadenosine phosphosulfate reductase
MSSRFTPEMPVLGHIGFRRKYGQLHRGDPDLCCHLNKVQPLEKARRNYAAWVSAIRRDQTAERTNTPIVELRDDGQLKLSPLANWTERDVRQYLHDWNLPEHPLLAKGYLSIGCASCPRAIRPGEDARAGRWSGLDKTECGIHLGTDPVESEVDGQT